MIRIRLPQPEAKKLEAEVRPTEDRKPRDRLQIVLLAHEGRKRQDIAADLCVNRRSVQRWLNAYRERGLAGLVPRKARGKDPGHPRLTGRPDQALGHRGARRARPRPGRLDSRGVGRPPLQGPRHRDFPLGHAPLLQKDRHPAVPPDLPLPAGR
jgi:hypothetical protein